MNLDAFRFTRARDIAEYLAKPALQQEACRDAAQRSIAGLFSYFVLWLILYSSIDVGQASNTLLEFLGFMLAAAGIGRLYLALRFESLYQSNPLRWRWLFAVGTIASAAIWGGVAVLALQYDVQNDGLNTTSVLVLLSTALIAANGIVSLAPAAWLGGIFVVFLLLPIVPFTWGSDAASERGIALLFLAFSVFMLLMWRQLHIQYWRALAGRADLVRAKEDAEAANRAKGQFIANVSHELRTPLTAILGALGLVESDLPDGLSPQNTKLINMAYQNGLHLSALINDLLDFEKLNAGRMTFKNQPLPLATAIRRALELNESYARQHKVSVVFENPPPEEIRLFADRERLQQVITNLLSNAVKHSLPGGTVTVSVTLQDGKARIAVQDRGPGVPEAFRSQIFGKFAQADSASTRKIGGTGLGLAISKAIVELMDGHIGYESEEGRGATFYFELPLLDARNESA